MFLKQIATLNSFRERNAISKEQYEMSCNGLVSKMGITERELKEWLNDNFQKSKRQSKMLLTK